MKLYASDYARWMLYGLDTLYRPWRDLVNEVGLTYRTLNNLYFKKTKRTRGTTVSKLKTFTLDKSLPYAAAYGMYLDKHNKINESINRLMKSEVSFRIPRIITYTTGDECWVLISTSLLNTNVEVEVGDQGEGCICGTVYGDVCAAVASEETQRIVQGKLSYDLDADELTVTLPDDVWSIFENADSLTMVKSWLEIMFLHLTGGGKSAIM